ncbi:Magnesium-chelatase subunit ChlH, chloroplastic [Frankliniella fusca]|uniref:Magnesium-chelatase subunit ChlH, chloroplastic n=1 Tax=Frankliniella fusca TaxID=407009 RepID=A0AAE1LHA0_9NEOP|nr:Magnesium-chelatase subunit ChlH, chloroplastic [Frankliniella fusca]
MKNRRKSEESMKKVDWVTVKEEIPEVDVEPEIKEETDEFKIHKNYLKEKVKTDVLTPSLLASLDRNALTDRKALRTVSETAAALGHDITKVNLSRTTIRRYRESSRANARGRLADDFSSDGPCVLHWDGKRLQEDGVWVERLVVVAVDLKSGTEQLLGILKLADGTGKSQAEAVLSLAREWDLAHRVVGLFFDTTASNTSPSKGACVLIELGLGRKLLRLACRHHVLELPVKGGFEALIGPSQSPDIPLFTRFKNFWPQIDQGNYVNAVQLQLIRRVPNADEMIVFCKELLSQEVQPRDDYKMLLLYTIMFLGGVPPGGAKFYKPIAVSKTRFMAGAIYCLLFPLEPKEKTAAFEVSVFAVTAHVRIWYQSRIPAAAPRSDLEYLHTITREVLRNRKNDARKTMWRTAGGKLLGHLWYLCPELVTLALFDSKVDEQTKVSMVSAMNEGAEIEEEDLPNKGFIVKLENSVLSLTLSSFVNAGSKYFFRKLGVDFLSLHPSEWAQNPNYKEIEALVKHLPAVNDAAERNVKIASDFHQILTKNEEHRQGLYLNVAGDMKKFSQK